MVEEDVRLLLESTLALDGQFGGLKKRVSEGPRGCNRVSRCSGIWGVGGIDLCALRESGCILQGMWAVDIPCLRD